MALNYKPILMPIFIGEELNGLARTDSLNSEYKWHHLHPKHIEKDKKKSIASSYSILANHIFDEVVSDHVPIVLCGDCLCSFAVLSALQKAMYLPDIIIWLDAHGDFHTEETTFSGFLGGMPLAKIVGKGNLSIPRAMGLRKFPEEKIIFCDGREIEPGEKEALTDSKVQWFRKLEEVPFAKISGKTTYLHIDTDVLDMKCSPAQNFPSSGGLSVESLSQFIRKCISHLDIVAISISSWNPDLDHDRMTERNVLTALRASLF